MKKEYLITTLKPGEAGMYEEQRRVKVTTDDLGGELEKLTDNDTRMVKVRITRQYADELEV